MNDEFKPSAIPNYGSWPNISNPLNPTRADHAAHTSPKGILRPEDMGLSGSKHKGALSKGMRFMKAPRKMNKVKLAKPVKKKKK